MSRSTRPRPSPALELAQEAFNWLQDFSYDRQHGGYFGFLKRDGTVVREASQCPWKAAIDVLGTPIGLKDSNVHSDLLETFAYLARVTGDSKVTERLAELVDIFCDKILLHFFYQADWTLVPHLARFGYVCQNAFRLLLAGEVIGSEPRLRTAARKAVDHVLQFGWDHSGAGIYYAGPGATPTTLHGTRLIVRQKSWWVQLEGLKAMMAVGRLERESEQYRARSPRSGTTFVHTSSTSGTAASMRRASMAFPAGDAGWAPASHPPP